MTEAESAQPRSQARGRESKEILRARNALKGVRGVLWLTAGVNGLGVLIGLTLQSFGLGFWLALAFAIFGAFGALSLFRFPASLTLCAALLQSWCAVNRYLEESPYLIASVLAALLWTCVPLAFRAKAILDEWGEEHAAERLSGKRHASADRSAARDRVERRRVKESENTYMRLGVIFAGISALVIAGIFVAKRASRPPAFDAPLARWEAAFEAGTFDVAESMCTDDYAERWPRVVKILAREGWHPDGVKLRNARIAREGKAYREVHSPLPRGLMKTLWKVDGREWRVDRVVFKDVKER